MKTLGIVGGIAPESTIDYYRSIIALYRERSGGSSYPSMIITSIDLTKVVSLVTSGRLSELTAFLAGALAQLDAAGATIGLLSSNTPHIVYPQLKALSPMPLLSIVDSVAKEAKRLGMKRVGLFGTRFTDGSWLHHETLAPAAIEVVLPNAEERVYIHDKYMNELIMGAFLAETRERMSGIANRMRREDGIDGLILGGTELPLLLREATNIEVPLLDSTSLHVSDAVEAMLT